MTAAEGFRAYVIVLPSIGMNVGSPSYTTVSLASERVMVAVCGIELAISASSACDVPGTETRIFAIGLSSGIFANPVGMASLSTYFHSPLREELLNHRPEISR